MNFTKRTEYALRALIEIGSSEENVPVKRDIIAKNQILCFTCKGVTYYGGSKMQAPMTKCCNIFIVLS